MAEYAMLELTRTLSSNIQKEPEELPSQTSRAILQLYLHVLCSFNMVKSTKG